MKTKKFKLILTILIGSGIILLLKLLFLLFYSFNLFNIQSAISRNTIINLAISSTLIDTLFCVVFVLILDKFQSKSNIVLTDVIGSDINQAYLFGQIGMAIINEEGFVLWISDYLRISDLNIVGKNIFTQYPELKSLNQENIEKTIKNIKIAEKFYEVCFLKASGLFIFKDISEYESYRITQNEKALCIGIISIDNYDDVVGNSDIANETVEEVRDIIVAYAQKNNLLLRLFRNDSYLVLCNNKSLSSLKDDKFSVINDVRKLKSKGMIKPTLSIGFGCGISDIYKLNEMASNSLNIAFSRGGDQVVVSTFGQPVEFYGGRSVAVESNNRVNIRIFSDSFISLVNSCTGSIFIMGHTQTDMDSLGACLGIKAICDFLNKKSARIVFEPKLSESKTRSAYITSFSKEQQSEIFTSCKDALDKVNNQSLIIVADISRPKMTLCPELLDKTDKIIVIDHHRKATDFIENPILELVEPGASSASELVSEMIAFNSTNDKMPLDPSFATIMLSGIYLDTQYFKTKNVSKRTFEASMILKDYGAENTKADDLLKDEFEEYTLVNSIISTIRIPYVGVCYCTCTNDEFVEVATLSKVSNQCIFLKGIAACFTIGRISETEVKISARSDDSINVQILMEKLKGGGHYSAAACVIETDDINVAVDKLLDCLANYLDDCRVKKND